MCELCLVNLKSNSLNRKLFLIAGSAGSIANDDGWGYADSTGIYKTHLPMFIDESAGEMLRTCKVKTPLLGHVRAASPQVPVCVDNSHPFLENEIIFMHNGSLKPKNEKDFVLEYKVMEPDKDGKEVEKTYKYSDSKMFFNRFLSRYKIGDDFVEKLKETMGEFFGKFAMMFYIGNDIFVVRGKTANLYISYLTESSKKDAKVLGYVINTGLTTLDFSTTLLSNMGELEGRPKLHFTYPELLPDETIWKAGELGLEKIGEIKENYSSYSPGKEMGAGNFIQRSGALSSTRTGGTGGTNYGKEDNLIKELHEFRIRYSLSVKDLSDIFMAGYGVSLLNIDVPILEHFFKRVVPIITKLADKDIRRRVKKTLSGICVNRIEYVAGKQFPWMMWTKEEINTYLTDREKTTPS